MKHMIYKCDRCKKEYDLCDDCYGSLEKWYMEGKKNNGCERTDQAV